MANSPVFISMRIGCDSHFPQEWIIEIEDISNFVREQYQVICGGDWKDLKTPTETVYPVASVEVAQKLGLSKVEKIG
jgi:hypothetical protein